jgi:hypothetical protein
LTEGPLVLPVDALGCLVACPIAQAPANQAKAQQMQTAKEPLKPVKQRPQACIVLSVPNGGRVEADQYRSLKILDCSDERPMDAK